MRHRLYRDVIHGQIRLLREADASLPSESILAHVIPQIRDTSVFQRLRSIRQNGLTNFVFPGMEHSRFAHSMGVFFLSRRMYDSIVRNSGETSDPRQRTLVAVAGLVHDIGHGPFSHSLEQAFEFDHEQMSVRMLTEHEGLFSILNSVDDKFATDLAPYISKDHRKEDEWAYRIISSQLDADRLDYMLRDSLFAGLKGHGFDLERVLDVLSIHNHRLTVEESSMPSIEAYLTSRLHLHEIVYFHKTVRASQCLLIAIFRRVSDLIRNEESDFLELIQPALRKFLLGLCESPVNLEVDLFSRVGDHHFWAAFDEWAHDSTDPILKDLCKRLVCRRPFKAVTLQPASADATNQQIDKAYDACAKLLGLPIADVMRYYCSVDKPKTIAYKVFDPDSKRPDEEIWMRFRDGTTKKLSDFKDNPVVQATTLPRTANFFVYPIECRDKVADIIPHKEFQPS